MLDRRREPEVERQEERARPQPPAPALQFGTLPWASALGNQAVARLARAPAEEELAEAEAGAPVDELEPEPELGEEAEDEAEAIPDDLPDELPA